MERLPRDIIMLLLTQYLRQRDLCCLRLTSKHFCALASVAVPSVRVPLSAAVLRAFPHLRELAVHADEEAQVLDGLKLPSVASLELFGPFRVAQVLAACPNVTRLHMHRVATHVLVDALSDALAARVTHLRLSIVTSGIVVLLPRMSSLCALRVGMILAGDDERVVSLSDVLVALRSCTQLRSLRVGAKSRSVLDEAVLEASLASWPLLEELKMPCELHGGVVAAMARLPHLREFPIHTYAELARFFDAGMCPLKLHNHKMGEFPELLERERDLVARSRVQRFTWTGHHRPPVNTLLYCFGASLHSLTLREPTTETLHVFFEAAVAVRNAFPRLAFFRYQGFSGESPHPPLRLLALFPSVHTVTTDTPLVYDDDDDDDGVDTLPRCRRLILDEMSLADMRKLCDVAPRAFPVLDTVVLTSRFMVGNALSFAVLLTTRARQSRVVFTFMSGEGKQYDRIVKLFQRHNHYKEVYVQAMAQRIAVQLLRRAASVLPAVRVVAESMRVLDPNIGDDVLKAEMESFLVEPLNETNL